MKYTYGREIPSEVLCNRLKELSNAVTRGAKEINREFYMSIPARVGNDADLVLSEAARRIQYLDEKVAHLEEEIRNF